MPSEGRMALRPIDLPVALPHPTSGFWLDSIGHSVLRWILEFMGRLKRL